LRFAYEIIVKKGKNDAKSAVVFFQVLSEINKSGVIMSFEFLYQFAIVLVCILIGARVGGIGYWPQDRNYLRNAVERPLVLLAQFNLGELPVGAAQVLALPASSLLAFYIDPHSDYYGMDALRGNGAVCVYFADTRTPSLSRAAQRAFFCRRCLALP